MAQSTEDYLDSLLRQAMGIPEPEPEKKPEEPVDLPREDVLAMADGLTGSNSAILGNAYDHNASFTNQGEIDIHTPAQASAGAQSVPEVAVSAPPTPEPAASDTFAADTFIPDSFSTEPILPEIPAETAAETVAESVPETTVESVGELIPEEIAESVAIPEGPVIEHDGNLDILPEPSMMDEIPLPEIEPPVMEEPVITQEV